MHHMGKAEPLRPSGCSAKPFVRFLHSHRQETPTLKRRATSTWPTRDYHSLGTYLQTPGASHLHGRQSMSLSRQNMVLVVAPVSIAL